MKAIVFQHFNILEDGTKTDFYEDVDLLVLNDTYLKDMSFIDRFNRFRKELFETFPNRDFEWAVFDIVDLRINQLESAIESLNSLFYTMKSNCPTEIQTMLNSLIDVLQKEIDSRDIFEDE